VQHLSGAQLYGRFLALPTNIRIGWKSMPGTNTPAYYKKFVAYSHTKIDNNGPKTEDETKVSKNKELKSFISQASEVCLHLVFLPRQKPRYCN
jgi:hypothetical protein